MGSRHCLWGNKRRVFPEHTIKIGNDVIYCQLLSGITALTPYPLYARASRKYNVAFPVCYLEAIDNAERRN